MLKRGYVGIYHRFSQKHLDRYVKEYTGRRNLRELDTIAQMADLVVRFSNVQVNWRPWFRTVRQHDAFMPEDGYGTRVLEGRV